MDDAVMKKSFNPSFPVSFRWTKYVFHNVDHWYCPIVWAESTQVGELKQPAEDRENWLSGADAPIRLVPPARGGGDLEMVQIDPGREHWTLAARPRELDRYSILTLISSKNQ